jgi:hypothetical protein
MEYTFDSLNHRLWSVHSFTNVMACPFKKFKMYICTDSYVLNMTQEYETELLNGWGMQGHEIMVNI